MSENDNDKHNYHNTINCDLKDIINKNINEISPSKIAELQYLQKLYENKKNIAERAKSNSEIADKYQQEKHHEFKEIEKKITSTKSQHKADLNHLVKVKDQVAYDAKQASIEAEKLKKETLRADENIQKAITKQNNIIEKLQYQLNQVNKDLTIANNEMKNKKNNADVQHNASIKVKVSVIEFIKTSVKPNQTTSNSS
ncbi:hypothetical protein Psal006b_01656 [Piscirickettsia salmonis]|uniref:Uncharacterized protein n=1 Tax=Piscirickettsia salmonis TaxID=1238 RepID=A0AAC8VHN9_PISSA|nr:hypothetical protein [Piscirickettsia salmonis]AKP73915.1 hypothetical protein PSLF89_2161 [Piscirickettsia salmonis LF-89 = ATCC VR-1361]ALB22733.1 hypothetical protein KU39_1551 [Piscirickettsia salmonis]ALY02733.1 hypothetical protein AWE47_07595 [Piscirickettsia salmonis]AMA42279.1 hypothetical protein AWJ11_07780 [Piscirickettsia salmonis]AOS34754.1 hypothetical protein AVM72_04940 [Piscirickettsia salmonis]